MKTYLIAVPGSGTYTIKADFFTVTDTNTLQLYLNDGERAVAAFRNWTSVQEVTSTVN